MGLACACNSFFYEKAGGSQYTSISLFATLLADRITTILLTSDELRSIMDVSEPNKNTADTAPLKNIATTPSNATNKTMNSKQSADTLDGPLVMWLLGMMLMVVLLVVLLQR